MNETKHWSLFFKPYIVATFLTTLSVTTLADTTDTSHRDIGKYLSSLLIPLTRNDHSVKDIWSSKQSSFYTTRIV